MIAPLSAALAWQAFRAYLLAMGLPLSRPNEFSAMPPTRSAGSAVAIMLAAAGAAILVAASALWFHYGTAVFFETIAAGIAGCF